MIDGSVALIVAGSMIQAAPAAARIAATLRPGRSTRIAAADAELARDPMIAAIAGVTRIYDRA